MRNEDEIVLCSLRMMWWWLVFGLQNAESELGVGGVDCRVPTDSICCDRFRVFGIGLEVVLIISWRDDRRTDEPSGSSELETLGGYSTGSLATRLECIIYYLFVPVCRNSRGPPTVVGTN
jgi:hypothetical protein